MAVKNMSDLFEHELKDIYYAENHLVDALSKMAAETKTRSLKLAFADHKKETQGHVKRLEKVFAMIGKSPRPKMCHGIAGLIKEKKEFAKEKAPKPINDFVNMTAGIKTERYEISAYESLIHIAREHIDLEEAADLLEENLKEEITALAKLQLMMFEHTDAAMHEDMLQQ